MKKIYSILFAFLLIGATNNSVMAQAYTMPTGNPITGANISTCSGTFADNNGPSSTYSNDQNSVQTFCSTAGQIIFTFTAFNTQSGNDLLYIYDGPSTASPQITGSPYSGNIGGAAIGTAGVVTSTSGCITFKFVSNGSTVKAGWKATITCGSATVNNNECTGATVLPVNSACSYTLGTTVGQSNSSTTPSPACANYTAGTSIDVWYSFVATNTNQTINTNTGTITDGGMALYSGTCGALTLIQCDDDSSPNGLMPMITRTDFIVGNTYYVRFWAYGSATTGTFNICVTSPPVLTCPAGLGTGVVNVASLPYTSGSQTTCGKVDDITSTNVATCGSTLYYGGEDAVYVFTPTTSGSSTIVLTSAGSYTGMMLYAGCPVAGGTCVGSAQSSTGGKSLCVNLTAGVTYYLVIDSWPSPTCNAYSLSIPAPSGGGGGATCATAVSMASLPYTATGQSTACMGNDYTTASTGSCNTSYESGEDKVYSYTATSSECLSISITNANTTYVGFQVYNGCPGSAGSTCVGNGGGATSGTLTGSVVLPGAGTYYLIIDTWASPDNCTYDLSVSSLGSGPSNDLPCNATTLTLGSSTAGDNNCSGSSGEPATPACWDTGLRNTVWYKVVATSSTMKIKTIVGTLTNTQIAVYSGACGAGMTLVTGGCNDNAGTCGSTTDYSSTLSLTGLTSGNTYYIAVDGSSSLTGTFSILAIDGSGSFPTVAGMDCPAPNPVCTSSFAVSDPGYAGFGATCDLPSSYCLASAERNVVWYTVPINANGNLVFDLVPNDFDYTIESETDYDFAVWRTTGSGAVTCAQISAGTAIPIECNYSGLGVTGLQGSADGDAPGGLSSTVCPSCPGSYNPDPTYDLAYQSQIPVNNGDVMLIAISNYSNSTSGFHIDFGASPIGYVGTTATSVTWTGGTSSDPVLASNWGGCNVPSCTRDGIVAPFANQPVITANQTFKDLTIQAGATLTINAGVTVTICGNLTNNGSLICSPTSTILFTNPITHTMSGNFTGTSALGNLTLTASGAGMQVNLLNNLDLKGTFTTSNANSIFNTNGNYIKLAGNFVNATGNTTFTNTGTTGTLEFKGTSAQTYNQGSSQLDLNAVVMNHTGTGVTLLTDMNIKATTGTLTLTLGKIITTSSFKVIVSNSTPTSVSTGNTTSYVYGFLRRYINNSLGSFDFPVGTSTAYERANVNFTVAPTITYLTADFQTYVPSTPGPLGSTECSVTYSSNALDNGFWNIDANTANNNTGTYNMTLYNTAYTNAGTAFTIMSRHNGSATWALVNGDGSAGTCVVSPVTAVVRNNMKGFSKFGTAQAGAPLPLELETFTGKNEGTKNKLEWTTASEKNNDFFSLERSIDGSSFETFYKKEGAGNSSVRIDYAAYDYYPYNGRTYYRLKQTDYDGNFSYSSIISLENKLDQIAVSNVHPNPTTDDLNFDFYSPVKGTIKIKIVDLAGRCVVDKTQNVEEGTSSLNTQMNSLAKGIYSLRVEFSEGDFRSITKVIKY
jgi:hypothetical protein